MTSVGVIWSAVARIKCLKALQKEPEISLPDEADELLKGLEEVKELLVAAYDHRKLEAVGAELEKQVVRLSYEIVDAIADASFKPKKEMFSVRKPTQRSRSGNAKLRELQEKLQGFKGKLNNPGSAGPEQNPGSEIQEQKPKKSLLSGKLTIPWKKSGNTKLMRQVEEDEVQKKNPAASPRSEQNPVQQQELLNQLKAELLNPDSSSEVYLVGESRMGKTTLANKLIIDQQLRNFFEVFAWVPIAHNFQIKGALQVLLQKLSPQLDMREMNEIELIAHIFAHLKNKKYLIVLDDINTADDWESIRLALPIAKSARVLITTSSHEIGHGKDHRHLISGLSKTDILTLLNKEAGFKPGSERVGEAIYDISGGSPLFAIILGNSLVAEAAASTESEQQLVDELPSYDSVKGTPLVLGASYKRLAPKLKPCLLYLGQFPPGQDIQVDNLYLLLMAENLISPEVSENSRQCLRGFLDELARLKLIHVKEDIVPTMTSGHYKSCRLHDQVRDFCRLKGSDEEFLEVVELPSSTKVGLHTRRLAVYLRGENCSIQFDSPDTVKKILSLLIFDTFESDVEKSEMNDLTEFIHLRILNYEGVNFKVRKILKGLDRLVLLRYLSFRGCLLEELPSSMSNLTQLETLDLRVQGDYRMFIPNNMFTNMKRMVHLYLPRLYRSSDGKTKVKLQHMEMLEILVNFDTEIFDVEALSHFKNLKILSTISKAHSKDLAAVIKFLKEGGTQQHSSVEITSFDCYNNGSAPELKELLQCRFLHSVHIEGRIGELPKEEATETVIGEIFLDGSELQLDPMAYLGKFQNLRRLVLWNDAFLGTHIHISAAPLFPNLRSLELQKLQFLEKITIKEEAMPKLSTLKIDGCGCLLELSIPKGMDSRLEKAQRDNGGDAYSVMPRPPNFKIT